jgi:hypothetical protein
MVERSTSRRTALTAQECVSRHSCVSTARGSTAEVPFITPVSRQGCSVWHVEVLRVASLFDRSSRASEVIRDRKGREDLPLPGELRTGLCVG